MRYAFRIDMNKGVLALAMAVAIMLCGAVSVAASGFDSNQISKAYNRAFASVRQEYA